MAVRRELVRVDAEVVGQLQLGLLFAGDAEEVVDRFLTDRQLPPLLQAERLVNAIDRSGSVMR
jgi:hypothetical protein